MDRIPLNWRIFSFLLGFCALLLVILWLFQTVFLYDTYKAIRTREIQNAMTRVQENIDSSDLYVLIEELFREKEILVTPTQDFTAPEPPPDTKNRARRQETITQTQDFTLRDGRTVSVTFHAMISPVDATVATLRLQLYIITGVMILLSVLLAVLIAKRISKPIEQINQGAKRLAAGRYETAFTGRGFLEIKELSDTLNTAAAELSKVEGLRRELMANVSHDLRTPLSLIYSYAEMMHDFPQEITAEQTQVIMDETKRLTSLVNDILDLSKLEQGIQEIHQTEFDLTRALRQITQRTAELVRCEGIDIVFACDETCLVRADEVKITQAFYNLLTNAIHYGGPGKQIRVTQTVQDGIVTIAVADQGEGIAEKDLPYIWDRYFKLDKKHKRAVTGTGLGLSIVKRIFEMHEITYGVQSDVGQGSVFWFQLERL